MDREGLESTNSLRHGKTKVTGRSSILGEYRRAHRPMVSWSRRTNHRTDQRQGEEFQTGGGSFNLGRRREPQHAKRTISRLVMMRISTATGRTDIETVPGRMNNVRLHSVR